MLHHQPYTGIHTIHMIYRAIVPQLLPAISVVLYDVVQCEIPSFDILLRLSMLHLGR